MSTRERVWWSAEVTDPVTGEVTTVHADSEAELDARVEGVLADVFPIPVEQGAGSERNLIAARQVMRHITRLLRSSTRLLDATHRDQRLVSVTVGVRVSPTMEQFAAIEAHLKSTQGGDWKARWLEDGILDITSAG